jgi:hypothetical protein
MTSRIAESNQSDDCFRWTVNVHEDLTFTLDLQGLPMSAAKATSKPALPLDSTPTALLSTHQMKCATFEPELHIPGPVPIFFSDDPEGSSKRILTGQPLLRHKMARLSWHFIQQEYIDLRTAASFLSSPREGHPTRPLCAAMDKPSPPVTQEFCSTSKPNDNSAGKEIGRNNCYNNDKICVKYSMTLTQSFRAAIRSAISLALKRPPDATLITNAEIRPSHSVSHSTWSRYISAWNAFQAIRKQNHRHLIWPLSMKYHTKLCPCSVIF